MLLTEKLNFIIVWTECLNVSFYVCLFIVCSYLSTEDPTVVDMTYYR